MADRTSIEDLGKLTTEPSAAETGPEADKLKAAQKAAAMGQATDPRLAARLSRAEEGRGGDADQGTADDPEVGRTDA